jgi:hypothetical protein
MHKFRSAVRGTLLVVLAAAPISCGGGGGGDEETETVVLAGVAELDGESRGGGFDNASLGLLVGNLGIVGAPGIEIRAFAAFDLSPLPPGARVVSAAVTLFQAIITTVDPYPPRGPVLLDHVNLQGALDAGDFDGGTLTLNLGILSTDATLGPKTLEVGSAVQADLDAGRTVSSFRLRFQTVVPADFTRLARFGDADGNFGDQTPFMTVTFER